MPESTGFFPSTRRLAFGKTTSGDNQSSPSGPADHTYPPRCIRAGYPGYRMSLPDRGHSPSSFRALYGWVLTNPIVEEHQIDNLATVHAAPALAKQFLRVLVIREFIWRHQASTSSASHVIPPSTPALRPFPETADGILAAFPTITAGPSIS